MDPDADDSPTKRSLKRQPESPDTNELPIKKQATGLQPSGLGMFAENNIAKTPLSSPTKKITAETPNMVFKKRIVSNLFLVAYFREWNEEAFGNRT
jgi:hypothetical protein